MPIVVRGTYIIHDEVLSNRENSLKAQARARVIRRQRMTGGARGCRGVGIIRCGIPISANKEYCKGCVQKEVANRVLNQEIRAAHETLAESD